MSDVATPGGVGCNLLWLVPGVVGGSEEYTLGLLDALVPALGAHRRRVTLFANRSLLPAHPYLARDWDVEVAPVDGAAKSWRVAAESSWLARESRRRGLAVVHHLGGLLPPVRGTPALLTVHDLQPLVFPSYFSPAKRWYHRFALPASVRGARRVVTLTDSTAADLVGRLGVREHAIEVIPPGVTLPEVQGAATAQAEVRARYGLGDRPFFLYPAIAYPHKNHVILLHAVAELRARHPEVLLVLTGGRGPEDDRIRARSAELGVGAGVRRLGRVPRADLEALYRSAVALAFPSRFEGFGLPVLEAMSRGCPALVAAIPALGEVAGPAAVSLPTDRPEEWTVAMARLLGDDGERRRLAELGRERARRFSWARAAERTVALWAREAGW